jgi:hypothetical protein
MEVINKKRNIIMNKKSNGVPQNIKHLLMEIGEKMVLFKLFVLIKDTAWDVYQNLGESGCDIVLFNNINNKKLKIEVKTRQRLYSSDNKTLNIVHYSISENEYINCDFVICYWLEDNIFFVVPKSELKPTKNKDKITYKFIVTKRADGSFNDNVARFLNKWDIIKL